MSALACQGPEPKSSPPSDPILSGAFWKTQAIDDIITPWTERGLPPQDSLFPAYLDRRWQPFRDDHLFPGMLARHVFSYATAYLLTGEEAYLDRGRGIAQYLIRYGWDPEYGLWFNELDGEGRPVDADKDLFMQLYAVTGLAMHYVVTRDAKILEYIRRSIELLNKHAWDDENGGYYNALHRDLTVKDDEKKATPQLAPLSGYLAYLYPATREQVYLQEMQRGVDLILQRMMDAERGWLLESFTPDWQVKEAGSARIDVGHNLEIVWMLLRLHLLTGRESYRDRALTLYPPLYRAAFHEPTGAWRHQLQRDDPGDYPATTPWWIQAYGNMLELYLYRVSGDTVHLDRFRRGAAFWNDHFIDHDYGGAYLSAGLDGSLHNGHKAVRSKTSYHSMEHGLLNHLYLKLWVENEPVTLYFRIRQSEAGDRFSPHLLEDPAIRIQSVMIDGKPWADFQAEEGWITLPALEEGEVRVELR